MAEQVTELLRQLRRFGASLDEPAQRQTELALEQGAASLGSAGQRIRLRADTDPIIRLVREEEVPATAEVLLRAYTSDYQVSDDYRADIAAVAERAREHQVWVAVDRSDGEVLGSVATPRRGGAISRLGEPGRELDFRLLGVAPAARGRGIGEQLTRHVLALGAIRGVDRVVMNSGPEMRAAHRLYYRLGFNRRREREHVIEDGGRAFTLYSFAITLPTVPASSEAVPDPADGAVPHVTGGSASA